MAQFSSYVIVVSLKSLLDSRGFSHALDRSTAPVAHRPRPPEGSASGPRRLSPRSATKYRGKRNVNPREVGPTSSSEHLSNRETAGNRRFLIGDPARTFKPPISPVDSWLESEDSAFVRSKTSVVNRKYRLLPEGDPFSSIAAAIHECTIFRFGREINGRD